MRKILFSFVGFFGILLFVKSVLAYDLTLTSVGSQSTLGMDYSLVTYTGGVPTLIGTASPSAQVGVKIKTLLNYATASTSGIWQYVPATLDVGDNQIVISSGTQIISFVLRFNATASATTATPAALPVESDLPGAGVWGYYIPALALGLGVFLMGRYGKRWMQNWNGDD